MDIRKVNIQDVNGPAVAMSKACSKRGLDRDSCSVQYKRI